MLLSSSKKKINLNNILAKECNIFSSFLNYPIKRRISPYRFMIGQHGFICCSQASTAESYQDPPLAPGEPNNCVTRPILSIRPTRGLDCDPFRLTSHCKDMLKRSRFSKPFLCQITCIDISQLIIVLLRPLSMAYFLGARQLL